MERACGYCMNVGSKTSEGCDDYSKGVFLLNHGKRWHCPRCQKEGMIRQECGFHDHQDGRTFKEVRVEFNYSPISDSFHDIAIVRDEAVWGRGSKYTLQSPLIRTEKRALKVAEAVLANLQRYEGFLGDDELPKTTEIILTFDDDLPEFSRKLDLISKEWEASTLAKPLTPASERPQD